MYAYLSKKIAIPKATQLSSLSWNHAEGWIACGGENGLLKILKLSSTLLNSDSQSKSQSSDLSMNQTLEGHRKKVICTVWNEAYSKLTTSDENGLIIVWMLHNNMWFEEMINDRGKSYVADMKWSSDGEKICIAYKDGAVILGSVDGNRLWGKDLHEELKFVQWNPNDQYILFVTSTGQIHVYNLEGNFVKQMHIPSLVISDDKTDQKKNYFESQYNSSVNSIGWHNGRESFLAIAFANQTVQIFRSVDDLNPVVIYTDIHINVLKWNASGSILAVGGSLKSDSENAKVLCIVYFYSPFGVLLFKLRVPGSDICTIDFEGNNSRLTLAVESFIYFVNICYNYTYGYLANANTLIHTYPKLSGFDETSVYFWNLETCAIQISTVHSLKTLSTCGELILFVTGDKNEPMKYHELTVCDAIGCTIDMKRINFMPTFVAMTNAYVIISNEKVIYIWQYRLPVPNSSSLIGLNPDPIIASVLKKISRNSSKERILDPSKALLNSNDFIIPFKSYDASEFEETPHNPIICLDANDATLLVGFKNGTFHKYSFPTLSLESHFSVNSVPVQIHLNCNGTLVSIIDKNGILNVIDPANQEGQIMEKVSNEKSTLGGFPNWNSFERKDVWDMKWSIDNPQKFAIMEKNRLVIFHGTKNQEPIVTNGYICEFADDRVKLANLDQIRLSPNTYDADYILNFETIELIEVQRIIAEFGVESAYLKADSAGKKTHDSIYRIIAEFSLKILDVATAEKCFIKISDYNGIQFLKKLQNMDGRTKKLAAIHGYLKNFDQSELLYKEIDRYDLAVDMRMNLGDYIKIEKIVRKTGNDSQLTDIQNQIGSYFYSEQNWDKATQYFEQTGNIEKLSECYLKTGSYSNLRKLILNLSEDSTSNCELLVKIGSSLCDFGQTDLAVDAFVKAGKIKEAIDSAVLVHRWDIAVELGEKYDFPQIEGLIAKHVAILLAKGKKLDAAELYRKANKASDAAILLAELAEESNFNPILAKKFHILAALEVERHRKRVIGVINCSRTNMYVTAATSKLEGNFSTRTNKDVATLTAATMNTLMGTSLNTGEKQNNNKNRVLDNAWRGAEAYHYYILAHKQLYSGNAELAMNTAIRCCEYEDILDHFRIYALIVVCSYYARYFNVCSQAFVKLETREQTQDATMLDEIQTLAINLFSKHDPTDPELLPEPLQNCLENGAAYQASTVSGRLILAKAGGVIQCKTCRHFAYEIELQEIVYCPLCHSSTL